MKSKFKNIFNKKTIIIVGVVVLICLIAPIITNAGIGESVARAIFGFLGNLVVRVAGLFVGLGATLLETMLDVGFSGTYRVIAETGWQISRDFANMIFILIMVLIAFGTILRIEQYGVKKLLPKLVIIALLINFSLPLSYLFIDFSNLTAGAFINTSKGTNESIRGKLIDSVRTNIMLLPKDCEDYEDPALKQKCEAENKNIETAQEQQTWYDIIIAQIVACIFMGLAAFSLIAGAVMLIIRMVYLAILVMLAPLALMCYIIPSLSQHWKEWWSNLLKWCFFAPVFMFFFWLATTTVDGITKTLSTSSNTLRPAIEGVGFISRFFANIANMIGYFLFIFLIMGGIIVAQKMGIAGANVAMSMAQKAKKGATDWAKRKAFGMAKERGLQGAGFAKQGAGWLLKKTPGFMLLKGTGRRMEAGGKELRQKSAEDKKVEAYKKRLALMSPEDRMAELNMKHIRGSFRLTAAQAVIDKDKHKMSTKTAQRARGTLMAYGYGKEADDFRDIRPDSIGDENKRREETLKLVKQGKLNSISTKAAEDPVVNQALLDATEVMPGLLDTWADASIENAERLSEAFGKFADVSEKALFAYSAISGNLAKLASLGKDKIKEFSEKWSPNAYKRVYPLEHTVEHKDKDGKILKETIPALSQETIKSIADSIPETKFRESVVKMENNLAVKIVNEAYSDPIRKNIIDKDRLLSSLLTRPQSQQSQETTEDIRPPKRPSVFESEQRAKDYERQMEDYRRQRKERGR